MVVSEIDMGEFDYRSRFPLSKTAHKIVTTFNVKTFSELCDIWLSIKETELTANTLRKTASQLKTLKHVINESTPINTIRHSDILNYRLALLTGETLYSTAKRNKTGRTVRTVDNYISLLCTLLRFAHRSEFINSKPYEGVKKLRKIRVKPDPLNKEEFRQLMESEHGQNRNLWQFAIYSGLRHGELAALAWEDIDLETGTVHVQRNLTVLGTFGPPKTESGDRKISLLQPALDALRAQRAHTALQPRSAITFHHREYGRSETQHLRFVFMPRRYNGMQKPHYCVSSIGACWNSAVKRAGIRRRNPYHTRHTFACWLLSAGANPSFIATQMGHGNAQMVYEVYGAWIEELNSEQIVMLNDKLAL